MISVVLPVYNCSHFIDTSVKSILNQTFKNFELLIINDGSTDNTEEVVLNIKDSRIRYFKRDHRGLSNTLNFGIYKSSFDFIARMDADDISIPERLQDQYTFLTTHPEYDIVSGWYAVFNNNKISYIVKTSERSIEIKQRLSLHSEICHPLVMCRKEVLLTNSYKTVAGVDSFDDYELWLRLKDKHNFYNIQKVLLLYRFRRNSISNENISQKYKLLYSIQSPYYEKELCKEFSLDADKELLIKGWREFFYGEKKDARKYWMQDYKHLFGSPRILFAFLSTYLPEKFFTILKEQRIKFRLQYYLSFYNLTNINSRIILKNYKPANKSRYFSIVWLMLYSASIILVQLFDNF